MMLFRYLMAIIFLFFSASNHALQSDHALQNDHALNKNIPIKLNVNLSDYSLNKVGEAKFTFLFWDIYHSTLLTESGQFKESSNENMIFKIVYLKNITAKELIDRTVEQWQHLQFKESEYTKYISVLGDMWPDIQSGDSLILYKLNNETVFYFNNVKLGTIKDHNFSKLFLDIWLSPNTSQPKLRKLLIGEES